MLSVSIKISGDKDTLKKINRFRSSLLDFTDAMESIGRESAKYFAGQVFASQGGILGKLWPTNLAKTIAYKAKHYPQYATATLIRTGEMKNSFTHEASANKVDITNTAPYFIYHQSTAPRTKMPYRPIMAINSDIESIVKKVLDADIKRKIARIT